MTGVEADAAMSAIILFYFLYLPFASLFCFILYYFYFFIVSIDTIVFMLCTAVSSS